MTVMLWKTLASQASVDERIRNATRSTAIRATMVARVPRSRLLAEHTMTDEYSAGYDGMPSVTPLHRLAHQ